VHNDSSRSSKVVDFDTNGKHVGDFLLILNRTLVLSCRVSEILELLYAESHFFETPYSGQNFRMFPRSMLFGSAEKEYPRLSNREIIFEEFQHVWSQSTDVTDGQTDRQLTIEIPRSV